MGRFSTKVIDLNISIILLCISMSCTAIHDYNNETDRLALLEFKSKITNDPFDVMSSWNITSHFCRWHGIQCGRRHERVTVLDLSSLKLSGSISPHVGNLSFLRELYLENNSFTGEIPLQISHLSRLQVLLLNNNSIGGKIPLAILSNHSNLVHIALSHNELVGEIPSELGSLAKLQHLRLDRNNLTGTLPPSLGNLSSLQHLLAPANQLRGNLPHTLGKLKKLKVLALSQNQFSGTMPSSIYNLSSIETIDVGYNNLLKGNLPSGLGNSNLQSLTIFSIMSNQFSGTIPPSISNASNLRYLQLGINHFTGAVPSLEKLQNLVFLNIGHNYLGSNSDDDDLKFLSTLTNATNLKVIGMESNNFGGELPQDIGNLSKGLMFFGFQRNQIFGNIPYGIFSLGSLQTFYASHNRLGGTIPNTIGKLQNLKILSLEHNEFMASIPNSMGNLTNLLKIDFSDNNLQGTIPSSLGNCKSLYYIDLSRNNLSGSIPSALFQLSSLSIYLGLGGNFLAGSLPNEVSNLKNLGVLDLENNMLSGNIPSSLGSCISLQYLSISNNNFQGPIPSTLRSLRGIEVLNVSGNNLSGKIPEFLESFNLTALNLSYNDFEGMVPIKGVFKNASSISVAGNKRLCGGIPKLGLPMCNSGRPSKRITRQLKIVISTLSVVLSVVLGLICLFLWYPRKKHQDFESKSFCNVPFNLSYQSLLKATNGFSSNNLIGIGSFGSVYKGILDHEETIIAVKVLNLQRGGASKSFAAECAAIRNIRHRNLVKVLASCSSLDYSGNDFKALVYEFMSNGSLDDWLHPIPGQDDEGPRTLDVLERLNIVIDVAHALEYLHVHCEVPIVHCDLKPSNVLLDDELTAHVSDFGLAKFLSNYTIDSANQLSSLGVRGTIGYCPPEYGMGSEVSISGDIFSFGIILLEMFTGKRPTDDMFNQSLSLRNFVKEVLPENVTQVIDVNLLEMQQNADITSNHKSSFREIGNNTVLVECLISILEIGISCSSEYPQERLNTGEVVAQLSAARKKLLRSQLLEE